MTIGRSYRFASGSFSLPAGADEILQILAPSDAVVIIEDLRITTDQETSEQLRVNLQRATTAGSGGTTVTARPVEVGDPAFGGTILRQNSTEATTLTLLWELWENVLNGWRDFPTPTGTIVLSPSGVLVIKTPAAAAGTPAVTITGVITEIGG